MTMTMDDFRGIAETIKSGDITGAYKRVDVLFKSRKDASKACSILGSLAYVVSRKNFSVLAPKCEIKDVFCLADVLCQIIAESWNCNHLKFVLNLYHINSYLLKIDCSYARQLCKYFFLLQAHTKNSCTEISENAVFENLFSDFFNLLERLDSLDVTTGENSIIAWLNFIFQLSELTKFRKIHKMFQALDFVLVRSNGRMDRLKNLISSILPMMDRWLDELSRYNPRSWSVLVEPSAVLLNHIVVLLPDVNDLKPYIQPLADYIAKFRTFCAENSHVLGVLEHALRLCLVLENSSPRDVILQFDYFAAAVNDTLNRQSMQTADVLLSQTVINLMYKFRRSFISANQLVESRLTQLFTVLLELSRTPCNVDSKKAKQDLEVVYLALVILNGSCASCQMLENIFDLVKTFIKIFYKAISFIDCRTTYVLAGVAEILNVMCAYKKAECTRQAAQICQYMFKIFSKLDPDSLNENAYFQNYVDVWLKKWADCCVKNAFSGDAQILLIIFAHLHPKYSIPAMEAWATLKKIKTNSLPLGVTVLDVINANREEIVKHNPGLKITDFNLGILLFSEVYAYSKTRELYGEPVLNVYKAAAKNAKDNYVALANILCCTVDAFSFDVKDKTHSGTLDASVSNLIAHLQKIQLSAVSPSAKSTLSCTLGNLFYCKVRLELQHIRRKCEEEVANEKRDENIPILTGEKDDLDVTEIVTVGSGLKMDNSKVLSLLETALKHWELSVGSLERNVLLSKTLSFLKGAGYLFRLYGYRKLEVSCWKLLYGIAAVLGSNKHQFLAVAELMLLKKTIDSSILQELESLKFDRLCYACHLFRVNFAKNLLMQGKIDECRLALEQIDSKALAPFFFVNSQYKVLRALLDIIDGRTHLSDGTPLTPIIHLFENLLYLVVNNQWETFNEANVLQWMLMETADLLYSLYADMNNVRSARAYLKVALPLAKKLALTARVCQVMTAGSWVDLKASNVKECELNAQEVESILELGVLKMENYVTVCSPTRNSGLKIVPHFLNRADCECHICLVTDYPLLVFDAIINRVLLLMGNGGHREASQVITIGFKVLDFVKENEACSDLLSTMLHSSIARFYYVVARANLLWENSSAAARFAKAASEVPDRPPVKNDVLARNTQRLLLDIRGLQSYRRRPVAVAKSRRFASNNGEKLSVTPENQIYRHGKPWTHTVKNDPKQVEGGYYLVNENGQRPRKSLYGKVGSEQDQGNEELDGISKLTVSPSATKKPDESVTTNFLHVPELVDGVPNNRLTNIPSHQSDVDKDIPESPQLARKIERVSKNRNNISSKTNLFFTPRRNLLEVPEQNPEGSSLKPAHFTPPQRAPSTDVTSQKCTKPTASKTNILGTPCLASLAKIGIGAKTPAIKVYYDPEGLQTTSKKTKTKRVSTVKKSSRLTTLSKKLTNDKHGTPKAPPSTSKKVVVVDDSEDEIELISAQFKRVLTRKGRARLDDTEKTADRANNSAESLEDVFFDSQCDLPNATSALNRTESTDSFLSASSHLNDSSASVASIKSRVAADSTAVRSKPGSRCKPMNVLFCQGETASPLARPLLVETTVDLTDDTFKANDSRVKEGEHSKAMRESDSSDIVAPFRKVLTDKVKSKPDLARHIFDETSKTCEMFEPVEATETEIAQSSFPRRTRLVNGDDPGSNVSEHSKDVSSSFRMNDSDKSEEAGSETETSNCSGISAVGLGKRGDQLSGIENSECLKDSTTDSTAGSELDYTNVAVPFRKLLPRSGEGGRIFKLKPSALDETWMEDDQKTKDAGSLHTGSYNLDETKNSKGQTQGVQGFGGLEEGISAFKKPGRGALPVPKSRLRSKVTKAVDSKPSVYGRKAADGDCSKKESAASISASDAVNFQDPTFSTTSRRAANGRGSALSSDAAASNSDASQASRAARPNRKKECNPKDNERSAVSTKRVMPMKLRTLKTTTESTSSGTAGEPNNPKVKQPVKSGVSSLLSRRTARCLIPDHPVSTARGREEPVEASPSNNPGSSDRPRRKDKSPKLSTASLENVNPNSVVSSPDQDDISWIESSFAGPAIDVKLPLARRDIVEEMTKLSLSSKTKTNSKTTSRSVSSRKK